jgi:murein L,D-transpeptidase YcbB/YkuD
MRAILPLAGSLVLVLGLAASGAAAKAPGTAVAPPAGAGGGPGAPIVDGQSLDSIALDRLYALRQSRPAWIGDAGNAKRADFVLGRLEHAEQDGLDPIDYHVEWLRILRLGNDQMAFDRALTDALIHYAHDLRKGRVEPDLTDQDIALPGATFDPVQAVADLIENPDLDAGFAALAPPQPDYTRLKSALRRYRAIAAAGGWPVVPDFAKDDPRLAILGARLAAEGFAVPAARGSDLKPAIKAFQMHHGLEPNGRITDRTLEALNVPASTRVGQIIANMERWRWLDPFGPYYLLVNVPSAQLTVYRDGEVILRSKLILGKPATPTPMFRAEVTGITVNPPWEVPTSIIRKEILPKLHSDPGYLRRENMVWGPDGGIRQLPGPRNSLGRLKVEMPNEFDSYLHDTPQRSMFARSERFFSHGCMRVEQIVPLVSILLTGDPTEDESELHDLISRGSTRHLAVSENPPVYVLYWTALANEDGSATFLPDIYGRDESLLTALRNRAMVREVHAQNVQSTVRLEVGQQAPAP